MAKFCSKCGNAVNETDNVCSQCGNVLNANAAPNPTPAQPTQIVVSKPKVPGRGFGITAMVLGIISLVATIAHFGSIMDVLTVDEIFSSWNVDISGALQSIIPTLCIWIAGSILAVAFSFIAKSRNYKNKVSSSGMVLGIIAFIMSIVDLIIICVNL